MKKLGVMIITLFCLLPSSYAMEGETEDVETVPSRLLSADQDVEKGLIARFWIGAALTASAAKAVYDFAKGSIEDVIEYSCESVDKHAPVKWDETYANKCLAKGQCNYLKQYLDRILMAQNGPESLADANAGLVWAKKQAKEGHTLCLYEVIRLFSKTVAASTGAIDEAIVQDYLHFLVLFFYRLAIDCIKIKAAVIDGDKAVKNKEKLYADKIRTLFGARIAIFYVEEIYTEAKKLTIQWLDENVRNETFPSFIETYSLQVRQRVSSGTYCQEVTESNVGTFLRNDKALLKKQKEIIEYVKNFFDDKNSLEELLSSGGVMIRGDEINQIFASEEE